MIYYDDYLYVSVGVSSDRLNVFGKEVHSTAVTGIELEVGDNHHVLKLVAPESETPGLTICLGEYTVTVSQLDLRFVSDGKDNADIEMRCTTVQEKTVIEIASFKMHYTMTVDTEKFTANCELKTFELKALDMVFTMNGKLAANMTEKMEVKATLGFNMNYTHGSTSANISAKDIVASVSMSKTPMQINLTVGDVALTANFGGRTVQANMSGSAVVTLSFDGTAIKG